MRVEVIRGGELTAELERALARSPPGRSRLRQPLRPPGLHRRRRRQCATTSTSGSSTTARGSRGFPFQRPFQRRGHGKEDAGSGGRGGVRLPGGGGRARARLERRRAAARLRPALVGVHLPRRGAGAVPPLPPAAPLLRVDGPLAGVRRLGGGAPGRRLAAGQGHRPPRPAARAQGRPPALRAPHRRRRRAGAADGMEVRPVPAHRQDRLVRHPLGRRPGRKAARRRGTPASPACSRRCGRETSWSPLTSACARAPSGTGGTPPTTAATPPTPPA